MDAVLPSAGVPLTEPIVSQFIKWPLDVTSFCELSSSRTAGLALMSDLMSVVTEHLVDFGVQLFLRKILFSVA